VGSKLTRAGGLGLDHGLIQMLPGEGGWRPGGPAGEDQELDLVRAVVAQELRAEEALDGLQGRQDGEAEMLGIGVGLRRRRPAPPGSDDHVPPSM
jgi:hypothetical protein